ncbi:MAG: GMP synthase [Rhodobacteraceae bacterium CG17_big_fil_post_rev_8_21_14_2_50_63_15]|nr:type 1 glutamine amidotransferase [Roseovarius sp.]PIV79923.1 MAG: GMP synthase [Rhodobacteraceae bacterium CG17_big_fil_post_rev_8_21_14_2_50_63_15]
MRVCILEVDRPEGTFLKKHGTYSEMFRRWLKPTMPDAEFEALDVAGGMAFPDSVRAYDGYLITGARVGVYDDDGWIAPLIAFLQRLRSEKRPLAGICFGHQVMAQAFGGEARKAECGWVLGRMQQTLTVPGKRIFGADPLWQMSMHQDQVIVPPPMARRLAGNHLSPNGAFLYTDFPGISVQFHPEFDASVMTDLLADACFSSEQAAVARAGLEGALDSDRVARAIAGLLRAS